MTWRSDVCADEKSGRYWMLWVIHSLCIHRKMFYSSYVNGTKMLFFKRFVSVPNRSISLKAALQTVRYNKGLKDYRLIQQRCRLILPWGWRFSPCGKLFYPILNNQKIFLSYIIKATSISITMAGGYKLREAEFFSSSRWKTTPRSTRSKRHH